MGITVGNLEEQLKPIPIKFQGIKKAVSKEKLEKKNRDMPRKKVIARKRKGEKDVAESPKQRKGKQKRAKESKIPRGKQGSFEAKLEEKRSGGMEPKI